MPTNPEFIKALLEKLSNIKNKNIEQDASIGGQNLKRTSSSTPKGDTNSESTPIPGTPNAFETKSTQKSTDSKSSNKIEDLVKDSTNLPAEEKPVDLVGKKNVEEEAVGQKTVGQKNVGEETENQGDIEKKNQEVGVEDSWVVRTRTSFQKGVQAQKQKEVEAQQVHYVVAEPITPFSKIRSERPLPTAGLIGFAIVSTFPLIQKVYRALKRKQQKKKQEEEVSIFVITHLFTRGIELGQSVIATESCDILNEELKLNPKIEQFMVGEIVGIIDESIYQVMVQVFLNKRFVYKTDLKFITPFIDLEEISEFLDPPFSPSYKLKTPSLSRRLIKKYSGKIKTSKTFRNLLDLLKYEPLSSKH